MPAMIIVQSNPRAVDGSSTFSHSLMISCDSATLSGQAVLKSLWLWFVIFERSNKRVAGADLKAGGTVMRGFLVLEEVK